MKNEHVRSGSLLLCSEVATGSRTSPDRRGPERLLNSPGSETRAACRAGAYSGLPTANSRSLAELTAHPAFARAAARVPGPGNFLPPNTGAGLGFRGAASAAMGVALGLSGMIFVLSWVRGKCSGANHGSAWGCVRRVRRPLDGFAGESWPFRPPDARTVRWNPAGTAAALGAFSMLRHFNGSIPGPGRLLPPRWASTRRVKIRCGKLWLWRLSSSWRSCPGPVPGHCSGP